MCQRMCAAIIALSAFLTVCVQAGVAKGEVRVDSVTPDTVTRGRSTTLVIAGEELDGAVDVLISDWRISLDRVSAGADQILVDLSIGERALAGPRDLTITFASTPDILVEEAFTVVPGAVSLISVHPATVLRGTSPAVQLQGRNLDEIESVQAGPYLVWTDVTGDESDPTRASATLTVTEEAARGDHDVTVIDLSGSSDTLISALAVEAGPISATHLVPDLVVRGEGGVLTAQGRNLDVVQSVQLGNGIRVDSLQAVDPTQLEISVTVSDDALPVGEARDAAFSSQGEQMILEDALTVQPGDLALSRIRPEELMQGVAAVLTIDGRNLDGADSFTAGSGITTLDVDPLSPIRVLVDLEVAQDAQPGYRDVTLQGTFGAQTVREALRLVERQSPPPQVNYPDIVDFGFVDVGARKPFSMVFYNETEVTETVVLEIARGDILDFRFLDTQGTTLDEVNPSRLTHVLGPYAEAILQVEFRPVLPSFAEVTLGVTVRDQPIGSITLRGRGLQPVLGFYPPGPISFPSVAQGETALVQVTTLSESAEPVRIEEIELWVERNGILFADAQPLTEIRLSEPRPPEEDNLFGATLLSIEITYPTGNYEGEIWVHTNRSTAPLVPLSWFASVGPPLEDAMDEPIDAGTDAWEDAPFEVAEDAPVETGGDMTVDMDLDTETPDVPDDIDGVGQDAQQPMEEGCCTQISAASGVKWHAFGFFTLVGTWLMIRRRHRGR